MTRHPLDGNALEPDPTPALGWKAMQTVAAEACNKRGAQEQREYGLDRSAQNCFRCRDDVRAIPGPTDAQLLAEAVKLADVRAMVDLLYRAWLGLRVMMNIAVAKELPAAAETTAQLMAEIEAAHPEFVPRSSLRTAKIGGAA